MKTLKIQFFTSCLLLLILSLSSCSRSYVGRLSDNEMTLAKAEENKSAAIVEEIEAVEVTAIKTPTASNPVAVGVTNNKLSVKSGKKTKAITAQLNKVKDKTAEKAIAMASAVKKAHKKVNNTNMKVWGIIMAASGIAAALIIGIWVTPTLGSLSFLWMVLAIAFAFWGIFIALLGEAYSWETKARE